MNIHKLILLILLAEFAHIDMTYAKEAEKSDLVQRDRNKSFSKVQDCCPLCLRSKGISLYSPDAISLRDQLGLNEEQLLKIRTITAEADLDIRAVLTDEQNLQLNQIADPPKTKNNSKPEPSEAEKSLKQDRPDQTKTRVYSDRRPRYRRYMYPGYRDRSRYSYRFRDRGWDNNYTWPGDRIHGYRWYYRPGLGWVYTRPPYMWGYYYHYPNLYPYVYPNVEFYPSFPRYYQDYDWYDYPDEYYNDYDSTDMYDDNFYDDMYDDDFDYRFESEGLQGGGLRQGLDWRNDFGNLYRDWDY